MIDAGAIDNEVQHAAIALAAYMLNAENIATDAPLHAEQIRETVVRASEILPLLNPGFDGQAITGIIQRFEGALETSTIMLQDLSFLRPLAGADHIRVLQEWVNSLRDPETGASVHLLSLNASVTPERELENNRSEWAQFLFGRYASARLAAFRPEESIQYLSEELARLNEQMDRKLRSEEESRWKMSIGTDLRRQTRLYEILAVLFDAARMDCPFTLSSIGDAWSLSPPRVGNRATSCFFHLKYAEFEGLNTPENLAGSLHGVIASKGALHRCEVMWQQPNWPIRGVVYEPGGTTMLLRGADWTTYYPFQFRTYTRATATQELPNAQYLGDAELDYLLPQVIGNRMTLGRASCTEKPANGETVIEVAWNSSMPWLYHKLLRRARYTLHGAPSAPKSMEAQLFADAEQPVGMLRGRGPITLDSTFAGFSEIVLEVAPEALVDSEEPDIIPGNPERPRLFKWQFESRDVGGAQRLLPDVFSISEGEETVVEAIFSDYSEEVPEAAVLSDPLAPLPAPFTAAGKMYTLRKQYMAAWQALASPRDYPLDWIREHLPEVEAMVEEARKSGGENALLRGEFFLWHLYSKAGESEKWNQLGMRYVEDTATLADARQVGMAVSSVWQGFAEEKERDFLEQLLTWFVQNRIENVPAKQLVQDAGGWSMGDLFAGAAYFEAAARKLAPSEIQTKLIIESAITHAEFALQLHDKYGWPPASLSWLHSIVESHLKDLGAPPPLQGRLEAARSLQTKLDELLRQ